MRFLNDISIKTKLIGAFVLIGIVAAVTGFTTRQIVLDAASAYDDLGEYYHPGRESSELFKGLQYKAYALEHALLLNQDPAKLPEMKTKSIALQKEMDEALAELKGHIFKTETLGGDISETAKDSIQAKFDAKLQTEYGDVETTYQSWLQNWTQMVAMGIQGNQDGAAEANKLAESEFNKLQTQMDELRDLQKKSTVDIMLYADHAWDTSGAIQLYGIIFTIIFPLLLGLGLTVLLTRPLNKCVVLARRVADGDLTQQVDVAQKDEIGLLAEAFNTMIQNLGHLIRDIQSNSGVINTTSSELKTTSSKMKNSAEAMSGFSTDTSTVTEDLNSSVSVVAAAIEESSANIQEIFNISEQVADNNRQVVDMAMETSSNIGVISSAAENMSESVRAVSEAIREMSLSLTEVSQNASQASQIAAKAEETASTTQVIMDSLGQAAREIGNVVDLITSIASQTNLLALNATIEAASAGDAGKGFAVVANEVKELAKQSGEATEGIRSRIQDIQMKTSDAISALQGINHVITEINQINHVIASAVEEQTITTQNISGSIGTASQAATEVSKTVQQVASKASEMVRSAEDASVKVTQITQNLEELSQGAAEISRNAQSVEIGAKKVSNNMEQVKSSAQNSELEAGGLMNVAENMAGMTARLEKLVANFQL